MKKSVAAPIKNNKLKEQKKDLEKMYNEAVTLVEHFKIVTVRQARTIEHLRGRHIWNRIWNVFFPGK